MADVFLSYSRSSMEAARRVAEALRTAGYSVWFDESLPAHRPYSDVIEEQLGAARSVVVLWSREAAQSQWVRSEANRARETGRLVQARLDDARLPMPFDQIQCADLRRWSGALDAGALRTILESVYELARADGSSRATASGQAPALPTTTRRTLLAGGGAAALAAIAGFTLWRRPAAPEMSEEAQVLLQKGMAALQDNDALEPQDSGSTLAAIALLDDATKAAPESPTAWGALAMAYAVRKRVAPLSERAGLDARSRAAAKVALELDPREARSLGALRILEPPYRNWLRAERADREALAKNPRLPILLFIMSDLLGNVGRWREAAEHSKRFERNKFLIPGADRKVILDLWCSGDLVGAERALEIAVQQWPQHPQIWRTRMAFLLYSGRPKEALNLLREPAERPLEISVQFMNAVKATAEALAGERPAPQAIRQNLELAKADPAMALAVAQACAALGENDTAFALLDGYYFGEGGWSQLAPLGGDQDRVTNRLFQPPMAGLWRDPRFTGLVDRIGLTAYWRESDTVPDYRAA